MKQAAIIGIGMSAATVSGEALKLIGKADVLIGAKRMTDEFAHLGKRTVCVYKPRDVEAAIRDSGAERFAVLVSGDVGFYSGAAGLCERLSAYGARLVPGVSSVSYFFAKLGLPWQDAALISCHGADTDIVGSVRRNRLTFALTGGNVPELAGRLCAAGFGSLPVRVGENLGGPSERIAAATAEALCGEKFAPLSVLLIENASFDPRVRTGIPDDEFIRADIPMTKMEIRAFCLSKLGLRPADICWDIGCGTGSVTVETALSAYKGHVYAIDKNENALALTGKNCAAFHIGNVTPVPGSAPGSLTGLPAPDAAFIGGSSGNMGGIVEALLMKNPMVRVVAAAVTLEGVSAAAGAMEGAGIVPEIVQLSAARLRPVGGLHMFSAQNPVFIVSGGVHG